MAAKRTQGIKESDLVRTTNTQRACFVISVSGTKMGTRLYAEGLKASYLQAVAVFGFWTNLCEELLSGTEDF